VSTEAIGITADYKKGSRPYTHFLPPKIPLDLAQNMCDADGMSKVPVKSIYYAGHA
jgi:hypothetical protein